MRAFTHAPDRSPPGGTLNPRTRQSTIWKATRMTDFGQLDEQLDAYDIAFTFKGEDYHITPTASQVLEFHRDYYNARKSDEDSGMGVWKRVAPLLGSKFNPKTAKITGGILEQIMEAGATYSQLERLVSAVHFKYVQGDDLAKAYFETGELGKAVDILKQRNNASQQD